MRLLMLIWLLTVWSVAATPALTFASPEGDAKMRAEYKKLTRRWKKMSRGARYPIRGCRDFARWVCAADTFVEAVGGRPGIPNCNKSVVQHLRADPTWSAKGCKQVMEKLIETMQNNVGLKSGKKQILRNIATPAILSEAVSGIRNTLVGPVLAAADICVSNSRYAQSADIEYRKRLYKALQREFGKIRKGMGVDRKRVESPYMRQVMEEAWLNSLDQVCYAFVIMCKENKSC